MTASAALLREAARRWRGLARLDAELLLCHCAGRERGWLYAWPAAAVGAAAAGRFRELAARRCRGESLAHLLGRAEFWSLPLRLNAHALAPRPETETLVAWALQLDLPAAARVADLGTGSGAIALALASERGAWRITATDLCGDALALARSNAARLGLANVAFLRSDWCQRLPRRAWHLLVSNPPYIAAGDPHLRGDGVCREPALALLAGGDGLDAIRELARSAPGRLRPGGFLLLEHGCDQAAAVRALLRRAGFAAVRSRCDLAGRERVSGGRLA